MTENQIESHQKFLLVKIYDTKKASHMDLIKKKTWHSVLKKCMCCR